MNKLRITFFFIILILPISILSGQCGFDFDCVSKLSTKEKEIWLAKAQKTSIDLRHNDKVEAAIDHLDKAITIIDSLNLGPSEFLFLRYNVHLQNGYNYLLLNRALGAINMYNHAETLLGEACGTEKIEDCLIKNCNEAILTDLWKNLYRPMIYMYRDMGFYDAAEKYFLPTFLGNPDCWGKNNPEYSDMLRLKGEITLFQAREGDTLKAVKYFQNGYESSINDPAEKSRHLLNLANGYRLLEDFERSALSLKKSYNQLSKIPNSEVESDLLAYYYLYLGYLARDKSRLGGEKIKKQQISLAIKAYQNASDYQTDPKKLSNIFLAQGKILSMKGDCEQAFKYYKKSLSIHFPNQKSRIQKGKLPILDSENPKLIAIVIFEAMADCWFKLFKVNKEIEYLHKAVDAHRHIHQLENHLRGVYYLQSNRQILAKASRTRLDKAIEMAYALWEEKEEEKALQFVWELTERGRALELKAALKEAILLDTLKLTDPISRELSFTEWELGESQYSLSRLNVATDNNSIKELETKITTLKDKVFELRKKLFQKQPNLAKMKFETKPIDLDSLKSYLINDKILANYFFTDTSLFLVFMNNDEAKFIKINKDKTTQLLEKLNPYIKSTEPISIPNRKIYQGFAFKLYEELLGPIKSWNQENLIVFPDGPLHYFSFDALVTDNSQQDFYKDFKYLWRDHTIQYAFSIDLLLNKDIRVRTTERATFDYLGFAPSYVYPSEEYEKEYGSELKYNTDEILEAGNLMESYGQRMKLFIKSFATKERFLEMLSIGKLLHLSMHASLPENGTSSNLAYLQFQPSSYNDESIADSNRLFLYEIYDSKLSADMVLLSTCYSAAGGLQEAEGVMSIGRGFYHAGASNVLMSLWEVDDEFSSVFIPIYFEFLMQGYGKAESLKKAREEIFTREEIGLSEDQLAPFYLSSFVLYGDDTPVFSGSKPFPIIWKLTFTILLISGLLTFFYAKKLVH